MNLRAFALFRKQPMSKPLETEIIKRIFADIIFIGSIFLLPWWAAVVIGCFFLFNFSSYFEFIFSSLIFAPLYFDVQGHAVAYSAVPLIASALFVLVEFLKTRLSGYTA